MRTTAAEIAALSRRHLEAVVAIDSQSNEHSDSIPSTKGQEALADFVAQFFAGHGLAVQRDHQANVLATLDGRGQGVGKPPIALLCHLDTSRGTQAVPNLNTLAAWDGKRIPYPENSGLYVDMDTYPAAAEFLGQTLLYGPGKAPFGLDDKLGLTHMMTLAVLLQQETEVDHPPLLFVGRPDEEIGRMGAVMDLAKTLSQRGVRHGFTIDGVVPFEINVENFHGSHASIEFADRPLELPWVPGEQAAELKIHLGGVNTHGCTAKAEGFRAATRLAAEILDLLRIRRMAPAKVVPLSIVSDATRDCDGTLVLYLSSSDPSLINGIKYAVDEVLRLHLRRGASVKMDAPVPISVRRGSGAAWDLLCFVNNFFESNPGFVLPAEDSEARQGYSNPYRARRGKAGLHLDIRLRDFDREGLDARETHVLKMAQSKGVVAEVKQQYANMGPQLASAPELTSWPLSAAKNLGIEPRLLPIRGGTGVDPFLDEGVMIGNLGTGYFAPESEKEFTSLEMMANHARWLLSLVQVIAQSAPACG